MSRVDTDGATPTDPLGFMKRLSPSVTYYEPTTSTIASGSNNAQAGPELILLSTWMGARENHIAKYVQGYRVIFPTSRILVAQCPFTHVVMPFLAWTQIRAAVPILREVVDSESRQTSKDDASSVLTGTSTAPRVLIHAFSNGGISTTLFLYNALKRSLGGTFTLPQHVFIFDSCPGTFRWRNTARAIMKILPRWSSPAVHAVLFSIWLFYRIVPVLQPRQNVNSRTIRNPRFQEFEVRRTYLYGTEDHMIPPTDVEQEAGLAAEAGFNVRLERFEDATHVAIPMLHPERYWRVVKESWNGEERASLTSIVVEGQDGDSGNLKAEISSETVAREITLVDQEKPISEEASILAEDVKSDGREAIKAVEQTAQDASKSAQSVVYSAATKAEEAKQQSGVVAEKAQSKIEKSMADAHTAIEQGQAKVKQLRANAAGAAKEVQIKANRKSLSKEANTIVGELKADAEKTLEDAKMTAKGSEKSATSSVHGLGKKTKEATNAKDKCSERPKTPDTSTALQAALAAASSSPEAARASSPKSLGRSNSGGGGSGGGSGVQELAARFGGGKTDKSTVKLPKAKPSQVQQTKADEAAVVVAKPAEQAVTEKKPAEKKPAEQQPVEQKPVERQAAVEQKATVEDQPKLEQPQVEQPKPSSGNKSKKSKKNGKK